MFGVVECGVAIDGLVGVGAAFCVCGGDADECAGGDE